MATRSFSRPADADYYLDPWSDRLRQGDLFTNVPVGLIAPPDAVVVIDGQRRFISGPFDVGPAMLVSPSPAAPVDGPGVYAHPARTLVPVRPVADLLEAGAVTEASVGMLRADRLRPYVFLPLGPHGPESAALLDLPIALHEDVVAGQRVAQLSGAAQLQLRVKLMAYSGGFLVDPAELGVAP